MSSYSQRIRKGLPRASGGEPWPDVPSDELLGNGVQDSGPLPAPPSPKAEQQDEPHGDTDPQPRTGDGCGGVEVQESRLMGTAQIRRGLPRVVGGDLWPPAGPAPEWAKVTARLDREKVAHEAEPSVDSDAAVANRAPSNTEPVDLSAAPAETEGMSRPVRRGLPRVAGGDAWPPAGTAYVDARRLREEAEPATPLETEGAVASTADVVEVVAEDVPAAPPSNKDKTADSIVRSEVSSAEATPASSAAMVREPLNTAPTPAKDTPTVRQPVASKPAASKPATSSAANEKKEPKLYGSRTLKQWISLSVLTVVGAVVAAAILVLAARGLTTFEAVRNFLVRYPGEYHLPETAEPGFPAWVRWTHFLNFSFMVLIIRSGLQVRHQKKPPAFWTPRSGKGSKVSINLWLHQSLDVLWLLNGVVFVVLLFVSGHWMRIVPTSWEVFPNALSALIQYMTLEWPVENGWVNYNSLQQLMYFTVVFIAAPLAAITGARMSDFWPKKAARLNKVYPVEVARALHFPTMLFFCVFIFVHVALVFSTGALRNLNHMFAGADVVSWSGFWWFAASIVVTSLAWFAARPMLLAPIASLFGKVSSR